MIAALTALRQAEGWMSRSQMDREIAGMCAGQPEALGALVERYQQRLYRYLLRIVREPATAEDLFQQTWMRVARNAHRYNPRRSFDAWLFSIARNLAIDYLRRTQPLSLDEPLESGETAASLLPARAPGALDALLERESAQRVAQCLEELPVAYREVLTLRFEEEMQLNEIAELLERPLSTVKTRLGRGLVALRRKLEARDAEDLR